ncbi:hypothetical protein LEP1GSC125_1468 [Leptospira mayottensis 200901122]|uniref:Uncharacterized protein n=1 Tax=Leptospira mayottensis 200901122 TaxID=1193010 RepID=A0AA87MQX1_9LEPT|nr:hypothetical protein LEP1GSC125_1468 [Leptospira mayottensis 200901122]
MLLSFLLGSSVFAKTRAKVYNDLWEALEDSRNVTRGYLKNRHPCSQT